MAQLRVTMYKYGVILFIMVNSLSISSKEPSPVQLELRIRVIYTATFSDFDNFFCFRVSYNVKSKSCHYVCDYVCIVDHSQHNSHAMHTVEYRLTLRQWQ